MKNNSCYSYSSGGPVVSVDLTKEMSEALDEALDEGSPVTCASIDTDGFPTMAFYGSTHVHDVKTLAIWVRDPNAGFLQRIVKDNHLALLYRNSKRKLTYLFKGTASILEPGDESLRVYQESHPGEQERDQDMSGRAVLIKVLNVSSYGKVIMEED